MVELWVVIVLVGALAVLFGSETSNSGASGNSNNSSGQYNRGVLQQTSPEKLRNYVATAWGNKGYNTEIKRNDAEYADVIAESNEESVAISVRRRQEENRVSANAVKRFAKSAADVDSDRSLIACTSYYTDEARNTAQQSDIELLDGEELADVFTNCDDLPA